MAEPVNKNKQSEDHSRSYSDYKKGFKDGVKALRAKLRKSEKQDLPLPTGKQMDAKEKRRSLLL